MERHEEDAIIQFNITKFLKLNSATSVDRVLMRNCAFTLLRVNIDHCQPKVFNVCQSFIFTILCNICMVGLVHYSIVFILSYFEMRCVYKR